MANHIVSVEYSSGYEHKSREFVSNKKIPIKCDKNGQIFN